MSAANDPTLEWTAFDDAACPEESDADQCFVLRAEVSGTNEGQGGCEVVAVDAGGRAIVTGATFGPLVLEPGRSFQWMVELQQVDDPDFDAWMPQCHPPGAG
jgi:hypothetical protein